MSKNKQSNISETFTEPESNKYGFYLTALLLAFELFLVFISNSKLAGEDDLFWYLSTGRYIVQSGSVPSADVFGFTTSGLPWIPFEWGWDIINYFLFTFGDYFALSIFSTLIILLIFYLLFQNLKKLNVNYVLIFFFLVILTLGICLRLTVKPHLISYLSLTLLLTIIIKYRYLERNKYKILYFIPLIFLFWTNLHMGVLNGLLLMGLYFFVELSGTLFPAYFSSCNIRPLSKNELIRLAAIIFLAAVSTLLNPHGIKTYEYAFHVVSLKQLDMIYEWQSPLSSIYLLTFSNFIYYFFIAGLIPVIYYSFRRKDMLPGLLCTVFFLYSMSAARLTVDFMLISVIFIVYSVNYFTEHALNKKLYNFLKFNSSPKIVLLGIILALIILTPGDRFYSLFGYSRTFGVGIDYNNFPVKTLKFIKSSGLDSTGSRPFNTYETGGYFIWNFPGKKNFIGSRSLSDKLWNDYLNIINIQPGFEEKIDSLKIDYFIWMVPLLSYSQNPAMLDNGILSYLFNENVKWKLVFWDDISFVFVKNEPKFDALISESGFKYFHPYNFYFHNEIIDKALLEDKDILEKEIERKQKDDSAGGFTRIMLKYYLNRIK